MLTQEVPEHKPVEQTPTHQGVDENNKTALNGSSAEQDQGVRVLDALSATGLRALRYSLEVCVYVCEREREREIFVCVCVCVCLRACVCGL